MPKYKIRWVNDYARICNSLDARVRLMETYLEPNPTARQIAELAASVAAYDKWNKVLAAFRL